MAVSYTHLLGDSSELYIDENNVYLADYIYKNGDTYTTVVKSSFGKGNFEYVGETALLGRLFDSEAIDEYQGVLRVITTCGNDNILYTLDQRLQKIGTLDNIAGGLKIKSIQFNKEKVYFVTTDEPLSLIHISMTQETPAALMAMGACSREEPQPKL